MEKQTILKWIIFTLNQITLFSSLHRYFISCATLRYSQQTFFKHFTFAVIYSGHILAVNWGGHI
jgi:hypothetical protein